MGLDYSYELYFNRSELRPVLNAVGDLGRPVMDEQITVYFPDKTKLTLPFSSSYDTSGRHREWDERAFALYLHEGDKSLSFNTSLYFEPDEAIESYVKEQESEIQSRGEPYSDWVMPRDEYGRYAIGYIYLSIALNLNCFSKKDYQPDLIRFCFTAATTRMSLLFEQSTSIRRTFCALLEKHNGICGLFDDETMGGLGWLIWPEQYRRDDWSKVAELLDVKP